MTETKGAARTPAVACEREGRVAWILFNNRSRNLLAPAMVATLDEITIELERDDGVRVVVLTGDPEDAFITHFDVEALVAGDEEEEEVVSPSRAANSSRSSTSDADHGPCCFRAANSRCSSPPGRWSTSPRCCCSMRCPSGSRRRSSTGSCPSCASSLTMVSACCSWSTSRCWRSIGNLAYVMVRGEIAHEGPYDEVRGDPDRLHELYLGATAAVA